MKNKIEWKKIELEFQLNLNTQKSTYREEKMKNNNTNGGKDNKIQETN